MYDKTGVLKGSKQEIANVFAAFSKDLFDTHTKVDFCLDSLAVEERKAPMVTGEEIHAELKKMAKNKSPDRRGIVAEMLQQGSSMLREWIARDCGDTCSVEKSVHNSPA